MAFFSLHKLEKIIRAQKDTLPLGLNKNVIYKLNCKNCDVSYVGQTKKRLNIRASEHKKDINKQVSIRLSQNTELNLITNLNGIIR